VSRPVGDSVTFGRGRRWLELLGHFADRVGDRTRGVANVERAIETITDEPSGKHNPDGAHPSRSFQTLGKLQQRRPAYPDSLTVDPEWGHEPA
jgi:hypothetical protein